MLVMIKSLTFIPLSELFKMILFFSFPPVVWKITCFPPARMEVHLFIPWCSFSYLKKQYVTETILTRSFFATPTIYSQLSHVLIPHANV